MGAYEFENLVFGDDAVSAFRGAVEQAAWDHGHAGYTGTIAEKGNFSMVTTDVLTYDDAMALMDEHMSNSDGPFGDKWGPAGCVEIDATTVPDHMLPFRARVTYENGTVEYLAPDPREQRAFLFFGLASS